MYLRQLKQLVPPQRRRAFNRCAKQHAQKNVMVNSDWVNNVLLLKGSGELLDLTLSDDDSPPITNCLDNNAQTIDLTHSDEEYAKQSDSPTNLETSSHRDEQHPDALVIDGDKKTAVSQPKKIQSTLKRKHSRHDVSSRKELTPSKKKGKLSNSIQTSRSEQKTTSKPKVTTAPKQKKTKKQKSKHDTNPFEIISKKSEKFFKNMNAALTGAIEGTLLVGISPVTNKAVIEIVEGQVYPETVRLNHVRKFGKRLWDKMKDLPWHAGKSTEEIEKWVTDHEIKGQPNMVYKGKFRLLKLGTGKFFENLNEQELKEILDTKLWTADAFLKAAKQTASLFLRSSNWKVSNHYQKLTVEQAKNAYRPYLNSGGTVIDLVGGKITLLSDVPNNLDRKVYVIPDVSSGQTKRIHPARWKEKKAWEAPFGESFEVLVLAPESGNDIRHIVSTLLSEGGSKYSRIEKKLGKFLNSNGGLKSLLQKIIRIRPRAITIQNEEFATDQVLEVACLYLAKNAGNFNSNIQRFTTGIEAFAKRLAVTIAEDSFLPFNPEVPNAHPLVSLLGGAFLIQYTYGMWVPSKLLLKTWIRYANAALENKHAVDYLKANPPQIKNNVKKLNKYMDFCAKYTKGENINVPGYGLQPYNIKDAMLKHDQRPLCLSSALLELCGSMHGDYSLLRWQAYHMADNNSNKYLVSVEQEENYRMPLEHAVDFHFASKLAYFFDPGFVMRHSPKSMESNGYETDKQKPFDEIHQVIWKNSSSLNPRRVSHSLGLQSKEQDRTGVVWAIRRAQHLYLCLMLGWEVGATIAAPPPAAEREKVSYELHDSWLSGMVGTIREKITRGTRNRRQVDTLTTLSVANPKELHVVIDPMSKTKTDITEEEQAQVKKRIYDMLARSGKRLVASVPDKSFKGCTLFLREDQYQIQDSITKNSRSWSEVKHLKYTFPSHPGLAIPLQKRKERRDGCLRGLYLQGLSMQKTKKDKLYRNCVAPKLKQCVKELVYSVYKCHTNKRFQMEILRRTLIFLGGFTHSIKMYSVARDGSGTDLSVPLCDVGVFHFLVQLCSLCPAIIVPSVRSPASFLIRCCPALWKLRVFIREAVAEVESANRKQLLSRHTTVRKQWPVIKDQENRSARDYQLDVVNDLLRNKNNGLQGNFIWIAPGMGKTMSVLMYLERLRSAGRLPPYVIYTMPKAAKSSVMGEMKYMNLECHEINPTQTFKQKLRKHMLHLNAANPPTCSGSADCKPVPYKITIIEHDNMRKCIKHLSEYASQCLFIVDEVHKALNKTQRTSACLQMAVSSKEFIAFTGTAVVDDKTEKLIGWLERIVPFVVNKQNFWAAANSIVIKKCELGIRMKDIEIEAVLPSDLEKIYKTNAPKGLDGDKIHPTQKELKQAYKAALAACTLKMVEVTLEILQVKGNTDEFDNYKMLYTVGIVFQNHTSDDTINHVKTMVQNDKTGDFRFVSISRIERLGQQKLVFELARSKTQREDQLKLYNLLQQTYKPNKEYQISSIYHIRPNVMLVAHNAEHRETLYNQLTKKLNKKLVFVTSSKDKNIKFTGQLVRSGQARDYRVVIVTKEECEGYDNTHCTHMITSIYCSNNAKREQMRGRIHRVSQEADTVFYIKVFATELMKVIKNNHDKASNLDKALQQYSKKYKMKK